MANALTSIGTPGLLESGDWYVFEQVLAWSLRDKSGAIVDTHHDDGVALATSVGKRRQGNQDRACVIRFVSKGGKPTSVAIVCDGLGGMKGGDRAAAIAVASIAARLALNDRSVSMPKTILEAVRYAN